MRIEHDGLGVNATVLLSMSVPSRLMIIRFTLKRSRSLRSPAHVPI